MKKQCVQRSCGREGLGIGSEVGLEGGTGERLRGTGGRRQRWLEEYPGRGDSWQSHQALPRAWGFSPLKNLSLQIDLFVHGKSP